MAGANARGSITINDYIGPVMKHIWHVIHVLEPDFNP